MYIYSGEKRGLRAWNVFALKRHHLCLRCSRRRRRSSRRVVGSLTRWGFLFTIAIGDGGGGARIDGDKFPGQ